MGTLKDLAALTDMLYRADQARMRQLAETETRLRRDIKRLEAHRKTSLSLPETQLQSVRQIGADLLWQAWVGRTREELNRQLALCLAQKARLLTTLRRSYGKRTAAEALVKKEKEATQQRKRRHGLVQEETLGLIKAAEQIRSRG